MRSSTAHATHPRATQASIDDRLWVSPISSTIEKVAATAWSYKDPQYRFAGHSPRGVPEGIDWSVFPDWYDLRVHWRGYIPTGVLHEVLWDTLDEHIVLARESNQFKLKAGIASWRTNRISSLRDYNLSTMNNLGLGEDGIPFPSPTDILPLDTAFPREVDVFGVMAASRSYYLDLVGFYCWIRKAFDDIFTHNPWDVSLPPSNTWKQWEKLPANGYLVDLSLDWETHNFPMWREHGIPFHYIWTQDLATNDRFRFWDPAVLQAHDETLDGVYDPEVFPALDRLHIEGWTYDEWLQNRPPISDNSPISIFGRNLVNMGNVSFFVQDFEHWSPRPIISEEELRLFEQMFYYEDEDKAIHKRTFYRYRERTANTSEFILTHFANPHLQIPQLLREKHKFRYALAAPSQGSPENPSLLRRLSGVGAQSPNDAETSMAPPLDDSEDEYIRQRSRRAQGRLRSASPASARASARRSLSPGTGARASARHSPIRSFASSSSMGARPPLHASAARALDGPALLTSILPNEADGYELDMTDYGRWSRRFLDHAIFRFPQAHSEWRIRAWLVRNPYMPITTLLKNALSAHIPFRLEIPNDAISFFRRPLDQYSDWEHDAAGYYHDISHERLIDYSDTGVIYRKDYELSVIELLNRPHAPAFLYEGGLLARIAKHYSSRNLPARAMKGPSAAITLHGAGYFIPERSTRREHVTDFEKLVLIGQSNPTGHKKEAHFIFPPPQIFNERFLRFDGQWTEDCEEWIQIRFDRIENNVLDAKTIGEWVAELRRWRRKPRLTSAQWDAIAAEVIDTAGPSWEGRPLHELFNLDSPENSWSEP